METLTRTVLFSAIFLFLLPLPFTCQAKHRDSGKPLDCFDLLTLLDLFRGEFDNFRQNEMDIKTGASDFHFYIHRFHVPVRVSALRRIGQYCSFTQQVYLEQYLGNSTAPFQRIFNFVLKGGRIFMETRKHRNASATKVWTNWRQNTKQFEDLKAKDLLFDSKCNVQWTRLAVGIYEAVNMTGDCTFNFNNRKVFFRSKVVLEENSLSQDEQFLSENGTVVSGTDTAYEYQRLTNRDILTLSSDVSDCQVQHCKLCLVLKDLLSTPKLPGRSKERNLRREAIQIFKSMKYKHPSCFPHKLRIKKLRAKYRSPKCAASPGK